jgi:hypothetical protein
MAVSREQVNGWILRAKEQGAKYIISVCDTFDYDDYPVFCKNEQELEEKKNHYRSADMQRINEVITINDDGSVNEQI